MGKGGREVRREAMVEARREVMRSRGGEIMRQRGACTLRGTALASTIWETRFKKQPYRIGKLREIETACAPGRPLKTLPGGNPSPLNSVGLFLNRVSQIVYWPSKCHSVRGGAHRRISFMLHCPRRRIRCARTSYSGSRSMKRGTGAWVTRNRKTRPGPYTTRFSLFVKNTSEHILFVLF